MTLLKTHLKNTVYIFIYTPIYDTAGDYDYHILSRNSVSMHKIGGCLQPLHRGGSQLVHIGS